MNEKTIKRFFSVPTAQGLCGARRVAILLLMTMLTSIGAWAQASMLKTDTEEPLGSAARHYVLMPVNANQVFEIPTDGSGRPVDGSGNLLRSFKLYDDGGKGGSSNWTTNLNYPGNYNPNNSCGIQIIAPEGYRLYINGRANLVKVFSVSHRGEYRDDYKNVATEEEKFTTWYGYHSFNESSTGRSATFYLTAYAAGGSNYSDSGFDLTITVYKDNETYNVNTASVPHGTVTTNKTTAKLLERVDMTAVAPATYYESTSTYSYIGNDNTLVNVSTGSHNYFMMPNSDVTFTNMFKPIDYTITYTNQDGTSAANGQNGMTNANPTTYNVETPNITLVEPKRFGYHFEGWYNNSGCTGSAITGVALPVGSHGNQTFYAKWTQNSGTTETITSTTTDVTINDNMTVTGTGGENTRLKIKDGATVTIKALTITVPNDENKNWPGIECLGDATIILDGTNTITVNYIYPSGIFVPSGKTLTIQEASTGGTLNINSKGTGIGANNISGGNASCGNIIINSGTFNIVSTYSVAIGASNYQSCGDITINGGTVITQGVAGIGSNRYGHCGNITIANTVTKVQATCYQGVSTYIGPYSIGKGSDGSCGTITIGGTVVEPIPFSPYIYEPSKTYTVTFEKGAGSGTMDTQTYYSGIPQNLNLSTFTTPDNHFFYNWSTESGGGGNTYVDGQLFLPTADMTLYAQYVPTTMTLTSNTGNIRLLDGMTLTGTGGKNTSVSIADGATVSFNNVTIPNVNDAYNDREYAVRCEGNATIFFEGTNEVDNSSRWGNPAFFVPENKTLTIIGTGSLTAKGGALTPGIGSRYHDNGGHIVINGGNVTAYGGEKSPGIGCCQNSNESRSCGDITIANTVTCVTAIAGNNAPSAIGSSNSGSCGTITIGDQLFDVTSGNTRILNTKGITNAISDVLKGQTVNVTFGRKFEALSSGAGKASTVCLPFDLPTPDKTTVGTFYTFGGVSGTSGEYVVTMNEVTAATLSAGTPYMFTPATTDAISFQNTAYTVPAAGFTEAGTVTDANGWQFKGTYEEITWPDGQTQLYAFAASNYKKSDDTYLNEVGAFRRFNYGHANPFRCYLWAPSASLARGAGRPGNLLPESIKVVLVSASGDTTGIGTLDTRTGEMTFGDEWYGLDGRKLDGVPTKKGIYIHNGKKVRK